MTAEFAREALRSSEASRPGIGRVTEPLAGPVANSSRPNPFAGPPVWPVLPVSLPPEALTQDEVGAVETVAGLASHV